MRGSLSRRASALVLCAALVGAALVGSSCDTDAYACGDTSAVAPHTVVAARLFFALRDEAGRVHGFDLDGVVSDENDEASCRKVDAVDPDGNEGIDNALSQLLGIVTSLVGDAIDGLVQMAVNDGTLLVMFRLKGLDSLENDPCVEVEILKGSGTPQLATTGYIAPSQTFAIDESTPISSGRGRVENGVLYAGPFDAVIPLKFFEVYVNMRMHGVHLRAELTEDGGMRSGLFGGWIEREQVMDVVEQAASNDSTAQSLLRIAPAALSAYADGTPIGGGSCGMLSAALRFEAEHAFVLGDAAQGTR